MSRNLDRRLTALAEAVQLADGRLEPEAVETGRAVTEKAGARLGLGIETTVVALAGPTGVGKSLLFNTLAEADLATVGRRRPTTSEGQAAVWGDSADPLLDWLEIGRRHRLDDGDGALRGLLLLDLPDFDSVESAHRLEVDRIVALADLVVWVVDPQKYADASLHDRYLRQLQTHVAAMAIVLNQADLLSPSEIELWREDVQRLLGDEGLRTMPVLVVSARTGEGLDSLRRLLTERVAARDAAVARLAADVTAAAQTLQERNGDGRPAGVQRADRERLVIALAEAGGVPRVVRAVDTAHRHRGTLATGWPFVRWVRRFRPDPLRRLRLGGRAQEGPQGRTSLPPATEVQHAQVATAIRGLADRGVAGLPAPWPTLAREAATSNEDRVADRLDRAVGSVDLRVTRPRWWSLAGLLQTVLAVAVAAGIVWLLALAVFAFLRVEDVVPLPEVRGIPIPTWLLVGGALAGILLAFLARLVNGAGARRRSRAAERTLRKQVEEVAQELVIGPVERELEAHEQLRSSLAAAGAGGRT